MTSRICLDTGPITLHFTKDEPKEITNLMNNIKQQKTEAYVISPILVEVFKHLQKVRVAGQQIKLSRLSGESFSDNKDGDKKNFKGKRRNNPDSNRKEFSKRTKRKPKKS